ncbi:CLUMA_CG000284, isoform A [Clunio marinus]|uniref:CLUMA_CG000284, isoform A n=1 Tax=Clunio marinus TaxID=568069 RepID=A0A1J1HER2_9DIPT|nr:CLUMA_CG000284, isoform A [Clunio marinus]
MSIDVHIRTEVGLPSCLVISFGVMLHVKTNCGCYALFDCPMDLIYAICLEPVKNTSSLLFPYGIFMSQIIRDDWRILIDSTKCTICSKVHEQTAFGHFPFTS